MNFFTFFRLQLLRSIRKKHQLVLLLLFFLCMLFLSRTTSSEKDSRIAVALCVESDDSLALTLRDRLLTTEDSLFRFFAVDSLDELTRTIENGTAECGYLIRKPLQYELEKKHLHNLIRIYVSETTTCKGIVNEYVYANLFEEYAETILKRCLKKGGLLPLSGAASLSEALPPVSEERIHDVYRSYTQGNETFTFTITTIAPDTAAEANSSSGTLGVYDALLPLFHGLTALFLLLGGFLALLTVLSDQAGGLYDRLQGKERLLAALLTMLAVLLPFAGTALLTLFFFGSFGAPVTELAALFVYLLMLLLFYGILGLFLPNPAILCGAFPMILLLTLFFTPVITDLSAFFPWIRLLQLFLPTSYYLRFF